MTLQEADPESWAACGDIGDLLSVEGREGREGR